MIICAPNVDAAGPAANFSGGVSMTYVDTQGNLRILKVGDTMSGQLAAKIIGVADPANDQDAATENYADSRRNSLQVLKAGDTMTGPLNINHPGWLTLTANTDVATIALGNRGMSVQFGNLAVGTTTGGPDLDI